MPFEIGAIEALAKESIMADNPDLASVVSADVPLPWGIMAGVSSGALAVTGLAGGTLNHLIKLKNAVLGVRKNEDLYTKRWGGAIRLLWDRGESVYWPGGVRKMLDSCYDHAAATADGAPITSVGFVDLWSGRYETRKPLWTSREEFIEAALASASLPGLFPGWREDTARRLDGGIRNVTPLADVLRLGATEVDVVLASPLRMYPGYPKPENIIKRLLRSIQILTNEVFINDLREMNLRNAKVENGDRQVTVRVVMPERHWSTGSLDFDPALMKQAYLDGLEKGRNPISLATALSRR